mmetsp:Transcript_3531/g.10285  ORF Transcript_3531/g.10285 Transcript_3531/m.10285 type:complete len:785 (-) Transcript_3531:3224-5578(-)
MRAPEVLAELSALDERLQEGQALRRPDGRVAGEAVPLRAYACPQDACGLLLRWSVQGLKALARLQVPLDLRGGLEAVAERGARVTLVAGNPHGQLVGQECQPPLHAVVEAPAPDAAGALLGLGPRALGRLEELALLEQPQGLAAAGELALHRNAACADVEAVRLLDVGGALVAGHCDPALLVIPACPRLDARHAPLAVLLALVESLKGFAHLKFPDGLALGDVEGRGDGDALHAHQEHFGLQQFLACGVLLRHPARDAVLESGPADAHHLEHVLLPGALQELHDLPRQQPARLRAVALESLLQVELLDAAVVGLGAPFQEGGALVALERGVALLAVKDGPALHPREAGVLLDLGRLQDLADLSIRELPQCLALLYIEMRRHRDVLHAPEVLLEHLQQAKLGDACSVPGQAEVQLARLQLGVRDLLDEAAHLRQRHVRRALAELLEEHLGAALLLPHVRPQGGHDRRVGIALNLLPRGLQGRDLLLALGLEGAQPHLQLHEHAAGLREGPLGVGLDLVEVGLDHGLALVHGLQRDLQLLLGLVHLCKWVVEVRTPGLHEGLGRWDALVHLLLQPVGGLVGLLHDRLGSPPVDGLLAPLLLTLHALDVLLLSLAHLLFQCRVDVLHLGDPGLQLQQLGLRVSQGTILHRPKLLGLLVDILGGLRDGLAHLLQRAIDALLAGGVGRVGLEVDGALVARQGDITLLAVLLCLGLHAQDAEALVLAGLVQGLNDLIDVDLAEGLSTLHRKVVRHRDHGGADEPTPELVRELVFGDLLAVAARRAHEGGL